jgi:diaminohydroxyphosphoribosylaminopyrimidine deaminase/5-amino-6-(5-phosphoribosylamino)uracil reductase
MTPGHVPNDEAAMQLALAEARRGIGLTAPNPPVGAVILKHGQLLGRGWHQKAGGAHAEIEALRDAAAHGHDVTGATIYITLEPCSTHGRTPPCTSAILAAGPARVVWGARDPNPAHEGRAEALLQAAGMDVTTGVCGEECQEILRPFAKRITTGLPWVIAKAGMSLDGRISRPDGEGQWLTGTAARADAMLLRSTCEAVLVGAETVRQDNPSLTIRDEALRPGQSQPWRVVLTKSGQLPESARVFTDAHRDRTLVFRSQPFETVLRDLADRGVMSLLIEGGGQILAAAFSGGWVDEVVFYTAPLISGSGRPVVEAAAFEGGSISMEFIDCQRVDKDLRINALVKKEARP